MPTFRIKYTESRTYECTVEASDWEAAEQWAGENLHLIAVPDHCTDEDTATPEVTDEQPAGTPGDFTTDGAALAPPPTLEAFRAAGKRELPDKVNFDFLGIPPENVQAVWWFPGGADYGQVWIAEMNDGTFETVIGRSDFSGTLEEVTAGLHREVFGAEGGDK